MLLEEINWLNLFAVWDGVTSRFTYGGFALAPLMIPTLYSTRLGVNCIKLLEIFFFYRGLHNGEEYLGRREQFNIITEDIQRFVDGCASGTKEDMFTYNSPQVTNEVSTLLDTNTLYMH